MPPDVALGLGRTGSAPHIAEDSLEPGDGLLFYPDGAIEGRASSGGGLGLERLIDLVGQTASDQLSAEEVVRHLGRSIVEHHRQRLDDDATLLLVQWNECL